MIWLIFVLQISLDIFLVKAQQHLPPQLKHYDKSTRKIHTEEYELLSLMMHHPEFVYSSFMENQLKSNASETLSQKCNTNLLRLIVDLASQEDYAIRSKFLHSVCWHLAFECNPFYFSSCETITAVCKVL